MMQKVKYIVQAIEAEQARKKKAQAQLEIEELYQKKTEAEQVDALLKDYPEFKR